MMWGTCVSNFREIEPVVLEENHVQDLCDRQTDRRTDRQTDGQTHRHADYNIPPLHYVAGGDKNTSISMSFNNGLVIKFLPIVTSMLDSKDAS